jgi:hypothetical protein
MEEPYRQVWPPRCMTAFDPEAYLAVKTKAYLSVRLEGVPRVRDGSRQMMLAFVCLIDGLPRDRVQIRHHNFRRRRGEPKAYL